ncbi:MAG: hypothetical protein QOI57_1849, partial [Rubrobacteraceae bacterium]|nr:hypothetical protein [Rubrobacteraceae bacterium]
NGEEPTDFSGVGRAGVSRNGGDREVGQETGGGR